MELERHSLGFLEIHPKPSPDELTRFYNEKYYGSDTKPYAASYSDEELFNKKLPGLEAERFLPKNARSVLDLGCGEGFFLDYFAKKGLQVEGADFTLDGIRLFFPELAPKVVAGNLFQTIERFISEGRRYDLVACNNVLEHVTDPIGLLHGIRRLLNPGGVCRIAVPNDDSTLQHEVVRRGLADSKFWVFYPDHLNYFNIRSLKNTLSHAGLSVEAVLSDFPIDFFLFNPNTAYKRDPSKGKSCHLAKVAIENMLAQDSIDSLIAFRKGCAEAGIGRNLAAYCKEGGQ